MGQINEQHPQANSGDEGHFSHSKPLCEAILAVFCLQHIALHFATICWKFHVPVPLLRGIIKGNT